MKSGDPTIQRLQQALADGAERLHGIGSRTEPAQIASELLRLNDAVRASTDARGLHYGAQPADFMVALLAFADASNEASR